MADGGEEPTAQGDSQPAPRQSWVTGEDRHLLVMTFAATLAANILTVLVVGGALALVHVLRSPEFSRNGYTVGYVVTITVIFAATYGINAFLMARTARRAPAVKRFRLQYLSLFVVAAISLLLLILALLGEAAGIK